MASRDIYAHYDGSRYFSWFSEMIHLPIDQVNFIISQVTCFLLALTLRYVLHPRNVGATVRHLFSTVSGIGILLFCHGRDSIHAAVIALICYLILKFASPQLYHKLVLGFSMVYLSCVQIYRVNNCYGCFVLDITGPLMLLVQKVTSLSFGLHDAFARDEKELSVEQKKLVVRRFPSLVEYLSYSYHFQTVLCGPLCFYPDYIRFVEGRTYKESITSTGTYLFEGDNPDEPPYFFTVLKKLLGALTFGVFFVTIGPMYSVHQLKGDEFLLHKTFMQKMSFLVLTTTVARFKYYHAWLAADAVANASGLGFNGYNYQLQPQWNLISNVDILTFELATSLRTSMENWNKGTMRWLRYVVYERVPFHKTMMTYTLSALWHGFYPGYYLCFGTAALVTLAARSVRRCLRYRYLKCFWKYAMYEIATLLATKAAIAYIVFPFLLLEFQASLTLYRHLYFHIHILCLLGIFLMPRFFACEQAEDAKCETSIISNVQSVQRTSSSKSVSVSSTSTSSITYRSSASVLSNGKGKAL